MSESAATELVRRGVNLGNALDVIDTDPRPITPSLVDIACHLGFNTVRLPVRWSSQVERRHPFTIEETFATSVDDALDLFEQRGLQPSSTSTMTSN